MSFVVGQWVECVSNDGKILSDGEFYQVTDITKNGYVCVDGYNKWDASRFRPVEWQVGKTYKTTLDGVTATISKVDSMFVYGTRSDMSGEKWMWHVATGLFDGYEDSTSESHLTPYLAEPEPSPAVETTEPSKATLRDSAAEIRELLSDMDSVWKEAETTSHPERLQHDEECPFVPVSRYHRTIHGVTLDLYDIAEAYGIDSHRVFHAVKKLVMAGRRGHKGREQDLREAIVSIESELKKMKGGAS